MENVYMTILNNYLKEQGVELANREEVVSQIESAVESIVPAIVHDVGDIVHDDEE